ncbi:hypothetical protein VPH35_007996 [Triticum aestivum]
MVLAGQRCVRGMRAFPRGGCRREASLRHCHYSVSFSSSVSSRSNVMLSSSHGAVPSWTDGSDDEYRVTRCCSSFFFLAEGLLPPPRLDNNNVGIRRAGRCPDVGHHWLGS